MQPIADVFFTICISLVALVVLVACGWATLLFIRSLWYRWLGREE